MPLTINTVTPRGGGAGTTVVVVGNEFGVTPGRVVFDPLGVRVVASPTVWANNKIEFPVPAGLLRDRFITMLVEKSGANDGAAVPFWVPTDPGDTPSLDYQYPKYDAGSGLDEANIDNPRLAQAADVNRLLALIRLAAGDMTKAVYDTNDDGIVDVATAIDDAGASRTWADILGLVGSNPTLDPFSPAAGQTVFITSSDVVTAKPVLFFVNGISYTRSGGHITVGGVGNRTIVWQDLDFTLAITDRVNVLFWSA